MVMESISRTLRIATWVPTKTRWGEMVWKKDKGTNRGKGGERANKALHVTLHTRDNMPSYSLALLFHFKVTSHIQGLFNRTIRMLASGIKPVFVFDGKPPTLKVTRFFSPLLLGPYPFLTLFISANTLLLQYLHLPPLVCFSPLIVYSSLLLYNPSRAPQTGWGT